MRPGHPTALQPLPSQYEAGGASPSSLDLSSNLEKHAAISANAFAGANAIRSPK